MTITVYSVSGSPIAWRVLLGLTFKGIEHNVKLLEASKNEHKSAEYLKIHPRGTVPAMDADGLILRDSIGILAWLDRQYPDRPLFGETPDEAAHIWQIVQESCQYLRAAVNGVLFPLFVEGKSVAEAGSEERLAIEASAQKLHDECQLLENLLGDNLYLAGDIPSAADAVCFPEIRLIERAVDTKPADMKTVGLASMAKEFPRLEAWKTRISELPDVGKTMPHHWS
jgi:maleylpyruvate isomerase